MYTIDTYLAGMCMGLLLANLIVWYLRYKEEIDTGLKKWVKYQMQFFEETQAA